VVVDLVAAVPSLARRCLLLGAMSLVRTRSQEALDQAAEEEELLQQQREKELEEEEIRHRLPREVIKLSKRFELQQKSIDLMQGNLSTLTEMVAQIGRALNASSVHQPTPVSDGFQGGCLPFSTPPHRPPVLSPIAQVETPLAIPVTSQMGVPPASHPPTMPPPSSHMTTQP
jgi:hypothetical protein